MHGLEGSFNTFRLGVRYSRMIKPGDKVLLTDKSKMVCFGRAVVKKVTVGKLRDMANLYAHDNHNQRDVTAEEAPDRLIAAMTKRYGPHLINENKLVTVVYLKL